jgi:hypothetical protein
MLQTIADDIWGLPCLAYHVQPSLEPETRAAFEAAQRAFVELWPEPLHVGPKHGLHVTIYPLVTVKGAFDKDAYWQRIARRSQGLLEELCTGHRTLELRFSRLKVTDTAIIATATEEASIPDDVIERIDSLPVAITAPVKQIRLVRETLFPCLVTDEIAAIPLIGR